MTVSGTREPMTGSLSPDAVRDILHFGYDPACRAAGLPEPVGDAVTRETLTEEYPRLLSTVQEAFRAAIDAELSAAGGDGTHVVPLSAGLDSRAILAALLERPDVATSDVMTVTFGMPGTWDFEIGKQVAAAAGVRNRTVDLRPEAFEWPLEELQAVAGGASSPVRVFERYVNAAVMRFADGSTVWSGFLGGTTTGQHVTEQPPNSWETAVEAFVEESHYTSLRFENHDPARSISTDSYVSATSLPYPNQLSFAHRQPCYIRPVAVGDGERCTPFANPEWLRVVLNVPQEYRVGRKILVDAMSDAFPDLFSLPTDANAGFPLSVGEKRRKMRRGRLFLRSRIASHFGLSFTHPDTNYVDFDRAFRTESGLRETAAGLVASLAERDLGVDVHPRAVWDAHQAGADRSPDIKVLCSLELYLREHG